MIKTRHFIVWVLAVWMLGCLNGNAENMMEGVGFMDFGGYEKCPVLSNASARVVLGPHCGGRILEYSLHGKNVLKLDPQQDGWIYAPGKQMNDPYGGRFDIGPEMVIPPHPDLWVGPWQAEVIGARKVRMVSLPDQPTGVQLVREFALARDSSRLRCTQIIKNISDMPKSWCHWSRTTAIGDGICVIPLTPESRFPNQYIMYGPEATINYAPHDKNITVSDDCLIISGMPQFPKLGIDSYAGWMAYIMKPNIMLIKHYPTYPERVYNEMAGITVSIYYYNDSFCELEPIGPKECILPGESAAYTEDWCLVPFDYPRDGRIDSAKVKDAAEKFIR